MFICHASAPDKSGDDREHATDLLFHALADATRRDILRRCGQGEASVSRLADAYPMSFAAVQKHVAVLEKAGLVTKVRRGREHLVHTDPVAIARARKALDHLELTWVARVDRMSAQLGDSKLRQHPAHAEGEKR
jgi:DNA-binding transcriptional ArsR family regulator